MKSSLSTCVFCDKPKEEHELIQGIKGDICKGCLAVCQTIDSLSPDNSQTKSPFDVRSLKHQLDHLVVGQEEAKSQLITELYKRYNTSYTQKNNILLVGDSGVGKTHLVRSVARLLDVPFVEVDATTFSETGYKGRDVAEIIDDIVIQADGKTEVMERAIIFIDEIDKVTSSQSGEPNTKVQHALLKMVEGASYTYEVGHGNNAKRGTLNTENILFIGAGACVGLSDIRKERTSPAPTIGFRSEPKRHSAFDYYTSQDLIAFGFIPELVGRFPLVLELQPLNREEVRFIVASHPNSIINQSRALFEGEGIEFIVTNEDIDKLVDDSLEHPLGVRSISHVLTRQLNRRLFECKMNGGSKVYLGEHIHQDDSKRKQKEFKEQPIVRHLARTT